MGNKKADFYLFNICLINQRCETEEEHQKGSYFCERKNSIFIYLSYLQKYTRRHASTKNPTNMSIVAFLRKKIPYTYSRRNFPSYLLLSSDARANLIVKLVT